MFFVWLTKYMFWIIRFSQLFVKSPPYIYPGYSRVCWNIKPPCLPFLFRPQRREMGKVIDIVLNVRVNVSLRTLWRRMWEKGYVSTHSYALYYRKVNSPFQTSSVYPRGMNHRQPLHPTLSRPKIRAELLASYSDRTITFRLRRP
jgi:hypothetical protein